MIDALNHRNLQFGGVVIAFLAIFLFLGVGFVTVTILVAGLGLAGYVYSARITNRQSNISVQKSEQSQGAHGGRKGRKVAQSTSSTSRGHDNRLKMGNTWGGTTPQKSGGRSDRSRSATRSFVNMTLKEKGHSHHHAHADGSFIQMAAGPLLASPSTLPRVRRVNERYVSLT